MWFPLVVSPLYIKMAPDFVVSPNKAIATPPNPANVLAWSFLDSLFIAIQHIVILHIIPVM